MLRRTLLAIIPIALVVTFGASSPASAAIGAQVPLVQMSTWGSQGAGNGQFSSAIDVAVDQASGNVYVADAANHRIQRFTADGTFLSAFNRLGRLLGSATLQNPDAVAVGGGNVYVQDRDLGQIVRYSLTGIFLDRWDVPPQETFPVCCNLQGRPDIAADSAGNVFVLTGHDTIQKYSSAGTLLMSFDGGTGYNMGIAVDSAGSIFLTGFSGGIMKYSATGVFILGFSTSSSITLSLSVDSSGNLWTLDIFANKLLSFTPAGVQRASAGPPQFSNLGGVAASTTPGILYVSDNNRVVRIAEGARLLLTYDSDASGDIDRTFTVSGPGPTQSLLVDDDADPTLSNTVLTAPLVPGAWHVDLSSVPVNANVKSITCSNGVHTVDYQAHAVDITLAPRETVTCNFSAEWIG